MLFTADHGEMLGDHGLSQKNCPYEPSVRVPLLLRWPGRTRAGATCDDPVGLTDVLPTLVAELGLGLPRRPGAAARPEPCSARRAAASPPGAATT